MLLIVSEYHGSYICLDRSEFVSAAQIISNIGIAFGTGRIQIIAKFRQPNTAHELR